MSRKRLVGCQRSERRRSGDRAATQRSCLLYSFCSPDQWRNSLVYHHVREQYFGNVLTLLALPAQRRPNRKDSVNSPRPVANDRMESKMVDPAARGQY